MAQQVLWATGKPGVEDVLLDYEADTAGFHGQMNTARKLTGRAVDSAERTQSKETAAGYEAEAGIREGLFGDFAQARQRAAAALSLSKGRDAQYGASLAFALTNDATRASILADDLAKRFAQDTLVRFTYVPTIRAQMALNRVDSAKAIDTLQMAAPYELGLPSVSAYSPGFYPVYVRAQAYLTAHRNTEAAAEFQKILDHRGIVVNGPIGALAHLGLARAYALQGDTAKARNKYQDFLTLWKDADPDIPILIAARQSTRSCDSPVAWENLHRFSSPFQ